MSGVDARRAHQAIGNLTRVQAENVALLMENLVRAGGVNQVEAERWIRDLDSNRFVVREAARRELEKLGSLAEPSLREAGKRKPSLHTRIMIEKILEKLEGPATLAEELQMARAVEVLEYIRSESARKLLRKYARGNPATRLTQEAKWALKRLEKIENEKEKWDAAQ